MTEPTLFHTPPVPSSFVSIADRNSGKALGAIILPFGAGVELDFEVTLVDPATEGLDVGRFIDAAAMDARGFERNTGANA